MKYIIIILLLLHYSAISAPQVLNSKIPITITADSLEVNQNENSATCLGNVMVVQDQTKLTAHKMVIHYLNDAATHNQNAISKIIVTDNVILQTIDKTASSSYGIFDIVHNIVELQQNITLTQGKNIIKGDKLIYNLTSGKAQIFSNNSGGVRAVLAPKEK
jgi:lipopolysaccharide export system protein LptA